MSNINLPTGWKKSCLGDITENVMYGLNSKAINYDGKKKYIRITDIDDNNKFSPDPLTSPDGNADDRYKLDEGDLLFARTGATVGKSYLYNKSDGDVYFAGFLIRFHILGAVPKFVFLQTQTLSYWNWVKSVSMRSGQPGINAEEYKKLPLILPPLHIQESIVEYLEQWDTAIEKTEALIDAKERQFGWLVTRLLNNRSNDQSWGKYSFSDIFSPFKEVNKSNEDFEVLSVTKDGIVSQNEYFNKEVASEDKSKYLITRRGSLVMSGLNFWMGSIDFQDIRDVGIVSPAYKTFKINIGKFDECYLRFFVRSKYMRKILMGASVQGASVVRRNLDKDMLVNSAIHLPPIQNQQKIAELLGAAEKEITLLKKLADQYRRQKRGLMQKLLSGKWHIRHAARSRSIQNDSNMDSATARGMTGDGE